MGADQSKSQGTGEPPTITQQEITSSEEFLKDYQFQEKIENDIQVLQHKTNGQLLAMREFNIIDEAEFKKIYDNLQSKTLLVNQNIVRLFYCLKEKESQLCSTFFKVLAILEYLPNNLEKEVNNRIELKQPFSEDELWNILTQCIIGISYLYEHSIPHDNIKPSTIYITSKGVVKVADPELLSQLPLYADTISQLNNIPSGTYLPPELLSAMFTQDYHPIYDKQKSDVFSLGMTVIHAALLQPLDDAYDYKNCTIDEGIVVQRLSKIRERYGQNLHQFLSAMVIMEPSERHDMLYLQQFLSQNSQSFAETPQHYAATQLALQQQQFQQDLDLNRKSTNQSRQISRRSSQSSQQLQKQSFQTQAKSMKIDPQDTGSILKCIPQDKESILPIPDENPNTNGQGDGFLSMESEHQQEPELPVSLLNNFDQRNGYDKNNNNNYKSDSNRINPLIKETYLNINNTNIAPTNFPLSQSHYSSKMASNNNLPQQQLPGSFNLPQQASQSLNPNSNIIYTNDLHTNPPVGINCFMNKSSTSDPINNPLNSQFNNPNKLNQTQNINNPSTNPVISPPIKHYSNNSGNSVGYENLPQSYPLQQQYNNQLQSNEGTFNNNKSGLTYLPLSSNIINSPSVSNAPDNQFAPDIEAILQKYRKPQLPQSAVGSSIEQFQQKINSSLIGTQNQPTSAISQLNQAIPQTNTLLNTTGSLLRKNSQGFLHGTSKNSQSSVEQYNNISSQLSNVHLHPNQSYANQTSQPYSNLDSFKLQQNSTNKEFALDNVEISNPPSNLKYPTKKELVVESYNNNSRYEGEKLNGMRHGYGKFFYQDGGFFQGEWRQNKMQGKGVLSYASGKPAYEGDWVEDKFEGFGTLYNENPTDLRQPYDFSDFDYVDEYWTKYEGQFKDDNKQGQGTLFLSNGERYVGEFDKDFVSGKGVFYTLNGQPFNGTWDQNKLVQ